MKNIRKRHPAYRQGLGFFFVILRAFVILHPSLHFVNTPDFAYTTPDKYPFPFVE